MKKMKKMLGLMLALCMLISSIGIIAYADGSETETALPTVSDVTFFTNGSRVIEALPAIGQSISAAAQTDTNMTLILAAYGDGGVLKDAAVTVSGKTVGGLTMQDGVKKVRLFAWNNLIEMAPATMTGTAKLEADTQVLKSITVNGVEADIQGNNISLYVPVWDADGNALSSWTVAATTQNGESVSLGDTAMTNGTATVTEFDFTTITAGTQTYQVKAYNQIFDDFDTNSVFSGSLVGDATTSGKWADGKTTLVKGSLPQSTFNFTLYSSNFDLGDQPYLSLGVAETETATTKQNATIPNGFITAAGGNGLRLSKTRATGPDDKADTGNVDFSIKSAMFKTAEAITVEYDTTIDYTKAVEGSTREVGLNGAGVRYNNSDQYTVFAPTAVGASDVDSKAKLYLKVGSTSYDGVPMGSWHHVKHVFSKEGKATTYIDGVAYGKDTPMSGAYAYNEELNLHFMVSQRRVADFWLDNLKITWNKPEPETLKSFSIDSYQGKIDNDTITVDVPYCDASGNVLNLNTLSTTTAVTSGADKSVSVNGTTLSGTTATKTGSVAYTGNTTVTAGSKTYTLILNRYFDLTFDDSMITGMFGGFTGTTKWSSETTTAYKEGSSGVTPTIFGPSTGALKNMFVAYAIKGDKDNDGTYLAQKSISFVNANTVKDIADSTKTMSTGVTSVSGNVMKINSPTNGNASNTANNYGTISFGIGTESQFNAVGAKNATQMSIEYDVAYGNETGNSGRISSFMNGLYLYAGANYTGENTMIGRIGGPVGNSTSLNATDKMTYQLGKDAQGTAALADVDMSAWRHVKVVFTRSTAASTNVTAKVYFDGKLQSTSWNDEDTKWPNRVSFSSATNRACQTYIDNVKIAWDVPQSSN